MLQLGENAGKWLQNQGLVALVLVLGFVAVWQLLPQVRRRPIWSAALAGMVALLLAGLFFFRLDAASSPGHDLLFCAFASLALVSGVCMISQRNPVYGALWFALAVLGVCGLFLLQSAAFLAAATIIIYAGAIVVTFLFVIMLAQQTGRAGYDQRSREPLLAAAAGFLLLGGLLYVLQSAWNQGDDTPRTRAWKAELDTLDKVLARVDYTRQMLLENQDILKVEEMMYLNGVQDGRSLIWSVVALREVGDRKAEKHQERWGVAAGLEDRAELIHVLDDFRMHVESVREAIERSDPRTLEQARLRGLSLPHSRVDEPGDFGKTRHLGRALFSDYLWAVELAGTLLLAAAVAAIAIALRREKERVA